MKTRKKTPKNQTIETEAAGEGESADSPAADAPPHQPEPWAGPMNAALFNQYCVALVQDQIKLHNISLHRLHREGGMDRKSARRFMAGDAPQFSLYALVCICNTLRFRPSRIVRSAERGLKPAPTPRPPGDAPE